ncbi:Receptor-like protein EIX2 [Glycine soja]
MLSTWRDGDDNRDCCKWKGIQCNNETGLVHMLHLRGKYPKYLLGTINITSLVDLKSIEYLDLSYNEFQWSHIPGLMGSFTNLRYLNLSYSIFDESMCTLQRLYLSNNKLNGEISSFFQNSSWCNRHIFKSLSLSYNNITGMLPKSIGLLSELEELYLEGDVTELHLSNFSKLEKLYLSENSLSLKFVPSWVSPFNLDYLELRSCKLGPAFPSWLRTQAFLTYLDISDNGLNDSVPEWFWKNMKNMGMLNLSHNNLTGTIPNLPLKLLNRPSIILNSNQFEGKIPSFLLQASALELSEIFKFVFILINNKLSGKIPTSLGILVKLEALVLGNNSLMGELPSTLKNCSNLIMLDVGENRLSGPIPSWIGENMQQLIILSMRGNHFTGKLPFQLCYLKHIQLLDLSRNNLSKGIPTCLQNITAMSEKSINISETTSEGVEQGFKDTELILKSIDLSCNNLTGKIPKKVGYLLGKLDLSYNCLSGRIPSGRHFETFEASSFEGNVDLCGEQLNKSCPGDGDQTTVKPQEPAVNGDDSVFYEGLYMSLGIGYFTGFWGLLGPILLWRPWRNAYGRFLNRLTDYIYVWLWRMWPSVVDRSKA